MGSTSRTKDRLRLRSYQQEMYDRSRQGNVIVAMDTGSGKTHVALLRIREEADRSSDKLIWFLAPTVALCEQQHTQINQNIPVLRTKLLIGSDNVDRWSNQRIWDGALENVQVVVSTHAVLADALKHGFVKITQMSLIVFDEAHHCNREHPANRIMKEFYHPAKELLGPDQVPHILGLTASPILRSNVQELQIIESNLDAVGATPRENRDEMMKYVHRPELVELEYDVVPLGSETNSSNPLLRLKSLCEREAGMGILIFQPGRTDAWKADRLNKSDEMQMQLFRFFGKAAHIFEELGSWAADYFIAESIAVLEVQIGSSSDILTKRQAMARLLPFLDRPELRQTPNGRDLSDATMSPKVHVLLQVLSKQDANECAGIVFVQQRVITGILCTLLSLHPLTKDRFESATFVGTANNAARKYGMTELLDLKTQRETLAEFRSQKKNLIIATNALEEGIDVSACNLVVCFNTPANVKSFIQRRGRARKEQSCFAILFPKGHKGARTKSWMMIEQELIETYQQDERKVMDFKKLESEEEAVLGHLATSCARITPVDAPGHLYHFCDSLPHQPYTVLSPIFRYQRTDKSIPDFPLETFITATVDLPSCLHPSLRHFSSQKAWRTEKAARRDASFQAYRALKNAELVNENLLPLSHATNADVDGSMDSESDSDSDIETTEENSALQAKDQWKPWDGLAKMKNSTNTYQTRIRLSDAASVTGEDLYMRLSLPTAIPSLPSLKLFWDQHTTFDVIFEPHEGLTSTDSEILDLRRKAMQLLVQAHRSKPCADDTPDYIAIISPEKDDKDLAAWLEACHGTSPAVDFHASGDTPRGFVRSEKLYNKPHLFHKWMAADEKANKTVSLNCYTLPRRRNFIKRQMLRSGVIQHNKTQTLSLKECAIDNLDFAHAQSGMFVPTILQHIERCLVAEKMQEVILAEDDTCGLEALVMALTAPSAAWVSDYQEFGFFGATVLRFIVAFQLYCQKTMWHEGYLSTKLNELVSNQYLAEAASGLGLDRFIMTDNMCDQDWLLPSFDDSSTDDPPGRELGSKVIASVVQALIGAAYSRKGFQTARKYIHIFIPEVAVMGPTLPFSHLRLLGFAHKHLVTAETVLGYTFKNKGILLEALTHASYQSTTQTSSWQRLRFLGDAVLDMAIVSFLHSSRTTVQLNPAQMTQIKAALVNSKILGFFCIHFGIEETENEVFGQNSGYSIRKKPRKRHLWQLMRFENTDMGSTQSKTMTRYSSLCPDILNALEKGRAYPWILLARLAPAKFLSHMVQSLIGGIFVDAGGHFGPCEDFIKRIGLWEYMQRLVSGGVNFIHPKNALARIAKEKMIQYVCDKKASPTSGERVYACRVLVDGVQISSTNGRLSKQEAILAAALKAVDSFSVPRVDSTSVSVDD